MRQLILILLLLAFSAAFFMGLFDQDPPDLVDPEMAPEQTREEVMRGLGAIYIVEYKASYASCRFIPSSLDRISLYHL